MEVRVPYLIQDPRHGFEVERCTFGKEPFCLDGPVSRRVAVLHFDDDTGELCPGVRFRPGERGKPGTYDVPDRTRNLTPEICSGDDFLAVNAFCTVLQTLYMFEEPDALGREIEWAFGAPQLLVVPRAGEWANAFYHRESHSLQFFHFPAREAVAEGLDTVYTSLSQDILAHETAHAVLDGIAPDLYNCLTPQSLALHEAIADLTAVLVAVRSRRMVDRLMDQTRGSIGGEQSFTRLAEQFGFERDRSGHSKHLRSLWSERHLCPHDETLDEHNRKLFANRGEPHLLSEVLSGALYRVFAHLHEEYKSRYAVDHQDKPEPLFSASGKALFAAREHFKRLVLRSLDYLPPGEVSFADFGRAILATDQASFAGPSAGRAKLVEEFVRRCIVTDAEDLKVETDFDAPALAEVDLEVLATSDWAAYEFAERNRALFGIPESIRFRVRPRLVANKSYYVRNADESSRRPVKELIFKVSWDRTEDNPRDLEVTKLRQITVGTTLAVDWETKRVRALLRSDASHDPETHPAAADLSAERNLMLTRLVQERRLAAAGDDPDGAEVRVETIGDVMRVRGAGRMLHLADHWQDDESELAETGGER